ncbi:MAG: hypothetical protein WCW16_05275 [Candidatus Magasanikbacteria bacterium]
MPKKKKNIDEKEPTSILEDHEFVTKNLEDKVDSTQVPFDSVVDKVDKVEKVKKPKRIIKKKKLLVSPRKEQPENEFSPLQNEDHIEKQLTEIYENGDGSMPDMKKFDGRKRHRVMSALLVLLLSCALLAVIAWVGFFVVQPRSHFSQEDVILSISGEEKIKVGQEVVYRVRYRNAQNVALSNVVLEVKYPKGFLFSTSTLPASNDTHDVWRLGSIEPQASGFIDITGKAYGDLNTDQSIRVFLNYTPANFSSEFQKVSHIALSLADPVASISIESPAQISFGSEVSFSVKVAPIDGKTIENLALSCESGEFSLKAEHSSPSPDAGKGCLWTFDKLDQERVFTLTGSFSGEQDSSSTLKVKLLGWNSADRTGDGVVLSEVEKEFAIQKTDTVLTLAVNGGMSGLSVMPGQSLNTSIVVKNSGNTPIENAQVRLFIDAPSYSNKSMLAWPRLDSLYDADINGEQISEDVRRGVITWDKRYIPELGRLDPGQEVLIDVSLPIKNGTETTLSNYSASRITQVVELQHGSDSFIVRSNEVLLTVASDMGVEVRNEITTNAEGNAVHTVIWLLSNSFHPLKDVKLTADIYGDVKVLLDDEQVTGGTAQFDEKTKKLVWTIPEIPLSSDVLAMQFDVEIVTDNPTQTNLTSKVKVQALDTVLNQQITGEGEEILLK